MNDYFLGIDPGPSGTYTIINRDFRIEALETFQGFNKFVKDISRFKIKGAACEHVWLYGVEGPKSATTFMKNAGGYESHLDSMDIRHTLVAPETWQKYCGVVVSKPVTKGLEKKQREAINRKHKKALKEKSVTQVIRFYGRSALDGIPEITEHIADALHIARFAVHVFG